ncbi:1921_t:CDS:2 [Entrophospora sp. SA101]|nr:1921_t:CDS:2 [Entrophospora sp. SA101]
MYVASIHCIISIALRTKRRTCLKHDDKISVKTQEGFIVFEDAKTDFENQFREVKNRLPVRSGERYHVVNNEDGNNHYDNNIYAAKTISDGKFNKNRIIGYIENIKSQEYYKGS